MSDSDGDEIGFDEQIKLYNLEKEGKLDTLKDPINEKKSYTDKDGVDYEWDEKQKAWFPKVSEDFIAMYQASYGVAQTSDGAYIYTDPSSKRILVWDEGKKLWTFKDTGLPVQGSETPKSQTNVKPQVLQESSKDGSTSDTSLIGSNDSQAPSQGDASANVILDPDSQNYVYKDPTTGTILYDWNAERENWIPRKNEPEPVTKNVALQSGSGLEIGGGNKKRKKKDKSLLDKLAEKKAPKPPGIKGLEDRFTL